DEGASDVPTLVCAVGRSLLPRRYDVEAPLRKSPHDRRAVEHAVENPEMMNNVAIADSPPIGFASLSAMRAAHTALLRHYREGSSPDLLAEASTFLAHGSATGALIDDDDDRMAAQSLLDYWAAILCRADQQPVKAVLDDFDPSLAPSLPDSLCPYLGLESFSEATQEFYFGRHRVVDDLLKRVQTNRLLAVVGPSGSGKSSLVLGGIVPALKAGNAPGSDRWRYYPAIVPGTDPIGRLVMAAQTRMPPGTAPLKDLSGIVAAVDASGPAPGVFVVDQFEELFTVCDNDETRRAF